MLTNALKTFSVLSLTVLSLQAHAGIGRITSAKECVKGSQNCVNIAMPKERSCAASATSLSGAVKFKNNNMSSLTGDSSFRGVYSVPGLGRVDKTFKASIHYYEGKTVEGTLRGTGGTIGFFSGTKNSSTGRVTINYFYVEMPSQKSGKFIEYKCSL